MKPRNKAGLTEQEFLEQYDPGDYERPSVTVDMLIFTVTDTPSESWREPPEKKLKVLLIKRKDHPFIGRWALPGGFVGIRESLDDAAARELKEETGLEGVYMEQLYTWGDPNRDPRTRVISCSYMALVDSKGLEPKAGDDAEDVGWFEIIEKEDDLSFRNGTELAASDIAFDHANIIAYGLQRLRNKIEYTDIAFNLMPEKFTLTELQQVYEIVLGKELYKANFRRKIQHLVEATDEFRRELGHRPARLYKKK